MKTGRLYEHENKIDKCMANYENANLKLFFLNSSIFIVFSFFENKNELSYYKSNGIQLVCS